jgi:hypothetical protein
MHNSRISANIILHFIFALFICGQGKISAQIETITIKNLKQHMDSIATDATEGRLTGSAGYMRAAQYAVNIFREAKLNPGYTNAKGEKSYFQPVPFISNNYDSATYITIRKTGTSETFDHSAGSFVILNPGLNYRDIPIASPVFIGYGINEPKSGWDDYAGIDVKGKWVILLNGIPAADTINPVFPINLRKQYVDRNNCDSLKYNALIKHKAAGVIFLPDKYAKNFTSNLHVQLYSLR